MKNRTLFPVAAVLLAALTVAAHAQDTRNAELAEADTQLNQTYRVLQSRLSEADKVKLRDAQRLWVQFRDADCKVGWSDIRDCLMQRTDERTEQLRSTYYKYKNGEYTSLEDRGR